MTLPDPRLEEIARLLHLDAQIGRKPRSIDLTADEQAQVDRRVAELIERPPTGPFGLRSAGVSPAGYIDDPLRKRLERVSREYAEVQEKADELREVRDHEIAEAVRKGVSLRTVGHVTGISHATVADIAKRRQGT